MYEDSDTRTAYPQYGQYPCGLLPASGRHQVFGHLKHIHHFFLNPPCPFASNAPALSWNFPSSLSSSQPRKPPAAPLRSLEALGHSFSTSWLQLRLRYTRRAMTLLGANAKIIKDPLDREMLKCIASCQKYPHNYGTIPLVQTLWELYKLYTYLIIS